MDEQEIFLAMLDIEDEDARQEYLQRACGEDERLRRRVESLFLSYAAAGDFLIHPIVCPEDMQIDDHDTEEKGGSTEVNRQKRGDGQAPNPLAHFAPSKRPDSLGRLGHYEILEVLGRGGHGTVYKAVDEKLHRLVAIKMMADELAATSPARQRFLREARFAAAIRQENVVAIHAVEEDPLPYMVMEYVPGKTLQDVVDEAGPLAPEEVVKIGQQIVAGLAAAHAQGLIHRDIKPSNILLEDGVDPHVKITDFGLARAAEDASLTQSGVIAGTPLYMSPEQANGVQVDLRSDLFSLGSVLYLLLTGRPPFRASTSFAVMQRVAHDQPRSLREIVSSVPLELEQLVIKLLSKAPEDRFQSAKEVAAALTGGFRVPTSVSIDKTRWKAGQGIAAMLLVASVLIVAPLLVWSGMNRYPNDAVNRIEESAEQKTRTSRRDAPLRATESLDSVTAQVIQEQWAAYLQVPVRYRNDLGMRFQLIPPGEFLMGTAEGDLESLVQEARDQKKPDWYLVNLNNEGPQHRVTISRPFYVCTHETTVADFREMVASESYVPESIRDGRGGSFNAREFRMDLSWENPYPETKGADDEPVRQVTWNDAAQFCRWLSKREKRTYRLLTEAEWEYACRAGTTTRFPTGKSLSRNQARFASVSIVPVCTYPPNAWGLCDMLGNVSEWCRDQMDRSYAALPVTDPVFEMNEGGQERAVRGGAFYDTEPRSAQRRGAKPDFRADTLGFRVALEIEAR